MTTVNTAHHDVITCFAITDNGNFATVNTAHGDVTICCDVIMNCVFALREGSTSRIMCLFQQLICSNKFDICNFRSVHIYEKNTNVELPWVLIITKAPIVHYPGRNSLCRFNLPLLNPLNRIHVYVVTSVKCILANICFRDFET